MSRSEPKMLNFKEIDRQGRFDPCTETRTSINKQQSSGGGRSGVRDENRGERTCQKTSTRRSQDITMVTCGDEGEGGGHSTPTQLIDLRSIDGTIGLLVNSFYIPK